MDEIQRNKYRMKQSEYFFRKYDKDNRSAQRQSRKIFSQTELPLHPYKFVNGFAFVAKFSNFELEIETTFVQYYFQLIMIVGSIFLQKLEVANIAACLS